jgi:hypothetical protein
VDAPRKIGMETAAKTGLLSGPWGDYAVTSRAACEPMLRGEFGDRSEADRAWLADLVPGFAE